MDLLLEGYELLRESVLAEDFFTATRYGLSVFLSRGMTAWIKVYQLLPVCQRPKREEVMPCGTSSDLVDEVAGLIADIFLSHKEVSRC